MVASTWLLSYNQLYLALPVELERATGDVRALGWLFALAAGMVVLLQLPLAGIVASRIGAARALPLGFGLAAASALLLLRLVRRVPALSVAPGKTRSM